jgi:hypothetical protein
VERQIRFGLQVFGAGSRSEWEDRARQAEDLGFDTILVPDHVADGLFPPLVALDAMAAVTTRLRIGTLVLNNDLRHPVLVARDAATIDLLSEGRLELGIGAGHAEPEYDALGVPFDSAATRVARLEESARILRGRFDGEDRDVPRIALLDSIDNGSIPHVDRRCSSEATAIASSPWAVSSPTPWDSRVLGAPGPTASSTTPNGRSQRSIARSTSCGTPLPRSVATSSSTSWCNTSRSRPTVARSSKGSLH